MVRGQWKQKRQEGQKVFASFVLFVFFVSIDLPTQSAKGFQ
jgi:hypothetical protein